MPIVWLFGGIHCILSYLDSFILGGSSWISAFAAEDNSVDSGRNVESYERERLLTMNKYEHKDSSTFT